MKKLLTLLLILPLFVACSKDDDGKEGKTPKGDNVTIEQIIGTYVLAVKRDTETNIILMKC